MNGEVTEVFELHQEHVLGGMLLLSEASMIVSGELASS